MYAIIAVFLLCLPAMPLNQEVFRVRALSAIVFVAIMLVGLLWSHWSFLLLFTAIHAGCWVEYIRLQQKITRIALHPWITAGCIGMGMLIMWGFCGPMYAIASYPLWHNAVLPLSLGSFLLLAAGILHPATRIHLKGFVYVAGGWLYLSLGWGCMLGLRQVEVPGLSTGVALPLILIGSIWINDTMAYIVGSFVGKTPLSPISPKKTWEGTIGGALLAIGILALIARYGFGSSWLWAVAIPTVGAVAGTLGDLWESKLKRLAGVKDSGQMMPGHGGFLDRFDSMLLAAPVAWLLLQLVLILG